MFCTIVTNVVDDVCYFTTFGTGVIVWFQDCLTFSFVVLILVSHKNFSMLCG